MQLHLWQQLAERQPGAVAWLLLYCLLKLLFTHVIAISSTFQLSGQTASKLVAKYEPGVADHLPPVQLLLAVATQQGVRTTWGGFIVSLTTKRKG